LAEQLRTNPVSFEGTLASIAELAARVNGIAVDATAGIEQQDRIFGSQRLGGSTL